MFFDQSDYNIPPCCSQKYFRFLFEHLRTHQNTTLFVLPDFDLARTIERMLVHVPCAELTLALPRPDAEVVQQLVHSLHRQWMDCTDPNNMFQSNQLVRLNLIIAPPRPKQDPQTRIFLPDESPRRTLLRAFAPYGERVRIFEAHVSTTILHVKNGTTDVAIYGDILQHSVIGNRDTTLRLLHATTDPQVLKELSQVLRMHMHKRQTDPPQPSL